jgi:hypothetical protein
VDKGMEDGCFSQLPMVTMIEHPTNQAIILAINSNPSIHSIHQYFGVFVGRGCEGCFAAGSIYHPINYYYSTPFSQLCFRLCPAVTRSAGLQMCGN